MARNVVGSFADAVAAIWNIVYDRNTTKESVKLQQRNIFLTMISAFYGDFEEKQVNTKIKPMCFVYCLQGEYIFQLFKVILKKNR